MTATVMVSMNILEFAVHDWRLIGLDVNRGLNEADISEPKFSAKAAVAARPIE